MTRFAGAISTLVLFLLLAGCDGFGDEGTDPPLDGQYDLSSTLTITAGEFLYQGQVTLQQNGSSFSVEGQVPLIRDQNTGDTLGTRQIEGMIGATYNHPSLTMIWRVSDPGEPDPDERREVWSIDATVSPEADTIDGTVQIEGAGNGGITLVRQ